MQVRSLERILSVSLVFMTGMIMGVSLTLHLNFPNENVWVSPNSSLRSSLERSSFTKLLNESGSDKYDRHHYERYYERWLAPYRQKPGLRFLEIGADHGHSLRLWVSYFWNDPEIIVGLAYARGNTSALVPAGDFTVADDSSSTSHTANVAHVIYGDQSKADTMQRLWELGPWDVIVDDGSHVPSQVLYTLFSLWQSIAPGGMYIIEDVETSYWKRNSQIYGYDLPGTGFQADAKHSVVAKLKEILDILPRHQLGLESLSVMPGDEDVCSMEWGMNLVAIRKCGPGDGVGPPIRVPKPFDILDLEAWKAHVKESNPLTNKAGDLLLEENLWDLDFDEEEGHEQVSTN